MEDDVGHGASTAAQRFEALIAQLVNPSDPTPKQTPETPDVKSQAYFLLQPDMSSGRVSYDDCKRTSEPSAIPDIKKGDMVDARGKGRSFVYYYPSVSGFDDFQTQVANQDSAVGLEGKGRRVFQCVGTARDAAYLTDVFRGRVRQTVFKACHL